MLYPLSYRRREATLPVTVFRSDVGVRLLVSRSLVFNCVRVLRERIRPQTLEDQARAMTDDLQPSGELADTGDAEEDNGGFSIGSGDGRIRTSEGVLPP
jgi:hypothetical protein